jgi:peptide/nickel transport system permease protein
MVRTTSDVEATPPEPISDAPAEVRVGARFPATPGQLGLTAILPGGGHLVRGEWLAGTALAFTWAFLLSVAFLSWGRIVGTFTAPRIPVDGVVSIASLVAMLAGIWAWAMYDLKVRAARKPRRYGDSQWTIAVRHFRKNRLAMAGLAVMLFLYIVTLLTPLIAPHDPTAQGDIVMTRFQSPSFQHPMGTDKFGRDVFSRVLYGARISLTIGFIAVGLGLIIGGAVGALAGYFGRWTDTVLMRFTDMMLSFPRLVLLIVIIALFEPSIWLVVVVLGLTGWMSIARIVRGEVLSLREREFVQAAKVLGMGDTRIITRHILPNTLAPVIVYATLAIGNTILVEAALSFLGLGVQPPTPSWGNMINDGRDSLLTAWWISTFPGLAIVLTVTAFNMFGDGLRDALDPRLRT